MQYAIFEINNRQYMVKPGQIVEVDRLPQGPKSLTVDKVLLLAEDGKVEIGAPYLKKTLNFTVLGDIKKVKIRVATYKAKANYRRVIGQRTVVTKIQLAGEKEEKAVKKSKG